MIRFGIILFLFPVLVFAQEQEASFGSLVDYFSGNWSSIQEACVGIGKADRQYHMTVGGHFLQIKNTAFFQPDSLHQTGSDHHDQGFFSYDKIRKKVILREFNSEGFVIEYVLDSHSPDGKTYTFLSETIENLPDGWLAKTTITLTSEDSFDELFEVAPPGGKFNTYVKSKWIKN